MLKPLPTSIQTFCDLINGGYLYIDKTQYLYELVRYPKGVYFLARPHRFGKSLLISTLDDILCFPDATALRESEYNRGTECEKTARPGLCGGRKFKEVTDSEKDEEVNECLRK